MPSIASSSPEVLIATAAANTTPHPRRLGRRDAAQPRAAARGRDLPHAQRPPSRPHRSRHRPRRRQRRPDAAARCARPAAAISRRNWPNCWPSRRAASRPTIRSRRSAWCPRRSTLPPIFLLGSSGASAAAAGELGVGYSFAAHFSADAGRLPPSPPIAPPSSPRRSSPKPHAILAVSALVAPTDEEAQFLSSSQAVSWALFHSGEIRKLVSPEEAAAAR